MWGVRISRWRVIVGAAALTGKFLRILRRREYPGPLTAEDLQLGEAAIFRDVQRHMRDKKEVRECLASVAPFVDEEEVVRMRGRAARALQLLFDARYPVVVVDPPAVVLLIEYFHRLNGHQNTTKV